MRLNSCLWGGLYNPIIPVFKTTPKRWKGDEHVKGYDIAKGYIRFFEPDVYVEAEEGLHIKAGLESFKTNTSFRNLVICLDEFISKEYRGVCQPAFGQGVFDILKFVYKNERRFKLRHENPAIDIPGNSDVFSEACIGVYPDDDHGRYISDAFKNVYEPKGVKSTFETWLNIYADGLVTPFSITQMYVEKQRFWHHEPIIYVFDPKKPIDLIDLWNLRIESSPVIPVPIDWFAELSDFLIDLIKRNYRPLENNPNGLMHYLTIETARSISEPKAQSVVLPALGELPSGSWYFKHWRNPVWNAPFNNHGPQYGRMNITAEERCCRSAIKVGKNITTEFETLSPDFAERYTGSKHRWANVIIPRVYGEHEIATVLPFNTFDSKWPRLGMGGERVGITQEGWVFLQEHKNWNQPVYLMRNDEAFKQWLEKYEIKANLSEPGRIAKQMLNSLGGLWGLNLLNDKPSLEFINKLAHQTRRRSGEDTPDILEEDFSGRSASIKEWKAFLNRRLANVFLPNLKLSDYTKRNVMKLGLETNCGHCGAKNWNGLDAVGYVLECERCLKNYDFPQTDLRSNNENWKYRVVGPFAIPDYARGSYASLLTIKVLCGLKGFDDSANFSSALELVSDKGKCEIDFAMWSASEGKFDSCMDPQLVIGEAKSFGVNTIKADDISKLKLAAEMLPGSVLVISVLREKFSNEEKLLLKEFVEWSRESENNKPKHRIILLTGIELFASGDIGNAWKEKGEPHSNFTRYDYTHSFTALSDATLAIYLGVDSYYGWLEKRRKITTKVSKSKVKRTMKI